jgi:hypothetical protein
MSAASHTIKLSIGDDIRRVKAANYSQLKQLIIEATNRDISELEFSLYYNVKYCDEENELVSITNNQDLTEALDCFKHMNKLPKLLITQKNPSISFSSTPTLSSAASSAYPTPSATPRSSLSSNSSSLSPNQPAPIQPPVAIYNYRPNCVISKAFHTFFHRPTDVSTAPTATVPNNNSNSITSKQTDSNRTQPSFICHSCFADPILGTRFQCSICTNFNLCAACEAKAVHPPTHPLIKIPDSAESANNPANNINNTVNEINIANAASKRAPCVFRRPLLKFKNVLEGICSPNNHLNNNNNNNDNNAAQKQPWCRKWCKPKELAPQIASQPLIQPSTPTTPSIPSEKSEKSKPKAKHMRDLSIPDRTIVAPGTTLVKTWLVSNPGPQQWPEGVKLVFIKGEKQLLAAPEFPVTAAGAEENVEINAVLVAPHDSGRYTAFFRLADAEGNLFGMRLWADIMVSGEADEPQNNEKIVQQRLSEQDSQEEDREKREE